MYTDHSVLKYLVNKLALGGGFTDGCYYFRSMALKSLSSQVG